jgi:pantoate kinase
VARAFAPAAITNFFAIQNDSSGIPKGATGGGFILSKGVTTRASITPGRGARVTTSVNGDEKYDARTTRKAVQLLLRENHYISGRVGLEQTVDTPIGSGFGASGASATSAVLAAAKAAGIARTKEEIAIFAHRAEIIEKTGLGTVSVVYDATGAGAITVPGEPGEAKFVNVRVPDGIRLVTASIAPFDKEAALSSKSLSSRINRFGREALKAFLSDSTFDTLVQEGERFSKNLGLESPEVTKLIRLAKSAGAIGASQNMIGFSMHSVVYEDSCVRVAKVLARASNEVRVDTFEIGDRRAGVLPASRRSRGPS